MKRSSGILMHISSLPSPYGIGTFGECAYDFIDFLERAGQEYWQVLPLNATSYGDSPYQSPSAFAGNPNFIDFDLLKKDGILDTEDYEHLDFGDDKTKVDYGKIFKHKLDVLEIAFNNSTGLYDEELEVFKKDNSYWLEDYALYMAIKYENEFKPWNEWDDGIKLRKELIVDKCRGELNVVVDMWIFIQYIFFKQWKELRAYANEKNIKIIGDVPIYVAEDSVDVWTKSENFLLDDDMVPIVVAGVPPDAFSDVGQYWGNPIYDWNYLRRDNYNWWVERMRANLKLYDVLRLDHFRGFESYWAIEYGSETAVDGEWRMGPNIDIFDVLKEKLGEIPMIIEDLGEYTEGLVDLRERVGYPPIKVLQFAFSSDAGNEHLPHHHEQNWVVYTGTHDNKTVKGWLDNASEHELDYVKKYLTLNEEEGYDWGIIRGAWSSVANLSIAQMQDFLQLGDEGRMNYPDTTDGNWQWRIEEGTLTDELADKIKNLTKIYGRLNI